MPGRATRLINRRLRRALEHRDRTCVVPGCGATRGLHAHHIRHWEDGGPTELANLVLLCPYHHRLHHRGVITITGPAHRAHRHRQRRPSTEPGIAGAPTNSAPARGGAVPGTHRRARRLVVVPTLPTPTTTHQLASSLDRSLPAMLQRSTSPFCETPIDAPHMRGGSGPS